VALGALGAVGLAIWGLGLLGMRLPALGPLSARLPAGLVSLPGAEQGINPNQLAGALVFLLPLAASCAIGVLRAGKPLLAALLAAVLVVGAATIVLTQSRAGLIGLAGALASLALALGWLNADRRTKKFLVAAVVLLAILGALAGGLALPRLLNTGGTAGAAQSDAMLQQLSLDARVEIWSRAVYALQDFPFTGVGLGAFRRVVNVLYPLFLVPPGTDIAHSHNMFLQAGLDMGLIGLIGYAAMLIVGGVSAWQIAAKDRGFQRYVAAGALAALVGLHVYGLADALALGSKPSAIYWVVLGLIAAMAASLREADGALAATPT
jgi:putative inorganic carbon (HCO3(-)) transporter